MCICIALEDSPMHAPAEQFLTLRAIGAPPIVIPLAVIFTVRFLCGLDISRAAISRVISEYLIVFILLWNLNSRVVLVPPNIVVVGVTRYLKSGGLLIGITIAVLVTMTLATSTSAREGPIVMAGYQISLEVWLALSLLTDALALASQALLASSYSQGNYEHARDVIYRSLQIGLGTGVVLAIILFAGFDSFPHLFSTDSVVLEIASSSFWFIAGTQPLNVVAFVLDGLYYGVSDFAYAAYSMVLIGLVSSLFILCLFRCTV